MAAFLIFELENMTVGMGETEVLSSLQWLPLLYESGLAALSLKANFFFCFFFVNSLPGIWVEIAS